MTPGELTRIEDTLRRAYADALAAVQRDEAPEPHRSLEPQPRPRVGGRFVRRRRWVVAAAAGAAVAAVALVAGLIVPGEGQHRAPRPPASRPPAASPQMAYIAGFTHSVLPVNLATGTALPPIQLGAAGSALRVAMAPNGRTYYVATIQGYVVPIDTATRTAGPPIRIGGGPLLGGMLLSPDGHTGYFEELFEIAVVDLVTHKPARFININEPGGLALTPDGRTLYVANQGGSEVTPIDTATLTTLPPVRTTSNYGLGSSIAIAPDGKTAYVLGATTTSADGVAGRYNLLTPISTTTNTALRPIQVDAWGAGTPITISPDSRTAYLSTMSGLQAVDLTTGKVRWTVTLGGNPGWQVVVSADSRTVYATSLNGDAETINRVSAATGAQLAPISIGWHASDVVLGPDGNLYVLSFRGMNPPMSGPWALTRFNAATGAAGPTISLPTHANPWTSLQFAGS